MRCQFQDTKSNQELSHPAITFSNQVGSGGKEIATLLAPVLFSLTGRGVFWVTRARDNMRYHVCKKRKVSGNVLRDDEVTLKTKSSKADYPQRMRRIVARVEVDGKEVEMVFITNNMEWAASSICGLYKSRWAIEVFFKQAIRWQLWSALLMYVLLGFQAWCSHWPHSFARLFTMIRGVFSDRFDLGEALRFYRTAGGK